MNLPLNLAAIVASSTGDDLRPGLDPESVTPGTLGFIFTVVIVVAVILLIRDMSKRIRRVRYNAMLEEGGTGPGRAARPGTQDRPESTNRPESRNRSESGPGAGTGTAPGTAGRD
ncbi:hypothetical protein E2F48_06310 [Arthrobacter crusticola]|uniref:Uncharacterized protein n=1 Tax=Arthrobacter crusticola TaxID=2547960 RepID=A0A4R5TZZ4_9MICC|nr:hypothetical protein [Arthrobacter crusticola]TDK26781.1 hypothetical protein E2F48_06310 [Arthrobacter crusticola]